MSSAATVTRRRLGWGIPVPRRAVTLPALGVIGFAGIVLALAVASGVRHPFAIPPVLHALWPALALFALGGDAVTRLLLPASLQPLRLAFVLPVGAAVASLALAVLGFAHVPLDASLAVVAAVGLATSIGVRVRRGGVRGDRVATTSWLCVLGLITAVALIPTFRLGFATVDGQNPDAHLVTGTAVLLQHAPPTATRTDLPINKVPNVWLAKTPIFYPLAAVAEVSGEDPVTAFPTVSALLGALAALGFGLLAVAAFGLSPLTGVAITALLGLDTMSSHIVLHPYWNQLWGLAMLPLALLFGWRAATERERGSAILFGIALAMCAFGYSLTIPYPLLVVGLVAFAAGRRPRIPRRLRRHGALGVGILCIVLAIPLLGAYAKLAAAAKVLLNPSSRLWGGDVTHFFSPAAFLSVGGGLLVASVVVGFAVLGARVRLSRPAARALAWALAVALVFDIRLRLSHTGSYMDFKHLSFVAPVVLVLAAAGTFWLLGRRRLPLVGLGAVALVAWSASALIHDRAEFRATADQVTPRLGELRAWAASLPADATIRLDIPASGVQLWAGYFMAARARNTPTPILFTTYPHAPQGWKADYSLAPRTMPRARATDPERPSPAPPCTVDPPVYVNDQFVLRRIVIPVGIRALLPDTASKRMVQPEEGSRFDATPAPCLRQHP